MVDAKVIVIEPADGQARTLLTVLRFLDLDPVHVHDVQATVLRCLGIDHKRLTFKFQGRHFRLTDVAGEVVNLLLKA